jgi:ubiquinone/menaquinone biosynthesis C-methylase UbiE
MEIGKIIVNLVPEKIKRIIKDGLWQLLNITDLQVELKQLESVLKHETMLWLPPPKHLQFRSVGSFVPDFIESGYRIFDIFDELLRSTVNKNISSFETILDFGCGCGRIIRAFRTILAAKQLYGTDIDPDAIAWLKDNCKGMAEFSVNPHLPPASYADNMFDLIFSVSIFTHLPEDMQFGWLNELKRIAKSGAYLILTTHGEKQYPGLTSKSLKVFEEKGFYYDADLDWAPEGLPSFYKVAFHSEEYIRREWSKYFNILNFVPKGLDHSQDIILLQKTSS